MSGWLENSFERLSARDTGGACVLYIRSVSTVCSAVPTRWAVEMAWTRKRGPSLSWATAGSARESGHGGELEKPSVSIIRRGSRGLYKCNYPVFFFFFFFFRIITFQLISRNCHTDSHAQKWTKCRREKRPSGVRCKRCETREDINMWGLRAAKPSVEKWRGSLYVKVSGISCVAQWLFLLCFPSAAQVYGQGLFSHSSTMIVPVQRVLCEISEDSVMKLFFLGTNAARVTTLS